MKKIIITEENKEMYEEYLVINGKNPSKNPHRRDKNYNKMIIISLIIGIIGSFISVFLPMSILQSIIMILAVMNPLYIMVPYFIYSSHQKKKSFINKYPNFDLSLDEETVKQLLESYYESIQIKKMLSEDTSFTKQTKDEKVEVVNRFINMSNEEKIAFLEKEKEFWKKEKNIEEEKTKKMIIGE